MAGDGVSRWRVVGAEALEVRGIAFNVVGIPKPQGSKRGFARGSKVVMIESAGDALKNWRNDVRAAATVAMNGAAPLSGKVSVEVDFYMPRPKSVKVGGYVGKRPDIDKLLRSTFDSMTYVVFDDDSQIVRLVASKMYQLPNISPGALISVKELE